MNREPIHKLWMTAVFLLLLASCQQDELSDITGSGDALPLSIIVADGGYACADSAPSRATENGYSTRFTAGDACGLFIVRDGNVVSANVRLTAAEGIDGNLTWQPDEGVALRGGATDYRYFLYYPYRADMDGKTSASAMSAAEFFAPLVSEWTPAADQSTYDAYTASDLMIASGTVIDGHSNPLQFKFSMTHCMAMTVIEFPNIVYRFTNKEIRLEDIVVAPSVEFSPEAVPCRMEDGTYRYIFNPKSNGQTTFTCTCDYGKREFTYTLSDVCGSYKTYKVNKGCLMEKSRHLRVGDYLLADGAIAGVDESLNEKQKAACVAVVFYVGQHENDQADYTSTGIGQQKCHGYAVALQDVGASTCAWGLSGTELGCFPTGQNNQSNPGIDWDGYTWTQKIIKTATDLSFYPATCFAAKDYQHTVAAPAISSGWYLPSIGQILDIYNNKASLLSGKQGATSLKPGSYWSSSENSGSPADGALVVDESGVVNLLGKNGDGYVRPVLAF